MNIFSVLASYIPADIDLASMLRFIAIFAVGSVLLGLIGRFLLGKRSGLNHAVSSAMGILFIYAVTIVVYTFDPAGLSKYLAPLPFATFSDNYLVLLPFTGTPFPAICTEVVSMVVLAFLVNLLDTVLPKGKGIVGWYVWRLLTVVLAMVLHYVVTWMFNSLLPGVLVTYAPMILLGVLILSVLLGLLKVVLGLALTVANPILGAVYTFFFANKIGKQLSKSVLTTAVLCAVAYLLEYLGYSVICIAASALGAYVPLIIALLILWYLIGHVL